MTPTRAVLFEDGQPANLVFFHQTQGLADVCASGDPDQRALGQPPRSGGLRVEPLRDTSHRDVAVGDDALHTIVDAADRYRPDVLVTHHPGRLGQRLVFPDKGHPRMHDLPY